MNGAHPRPDIGLESLLVFPSERETAGRRRSSWRIVTAGVLMVVVCVAALLAARPRWLGLPAGSSAGVQVETRPPGAEVFIDGQRRGVTPLSLALGAGAHALVVRLDGDMRTAPLNVASGSSLAMYFDMQSAPPAALVPPASPVTVAGVTAPGAGQGAIDAGAHGAPALAGGPIGGWLTVTSPFEVRVTEGGDVVGVSAAARIMLAAGRHDVVLVNESLQYAEPRRIEIAAGRVTVVHIDPPPASLSVNARPWADVSIDGTNAGQTPLANLTLPVGTHQVVFSHPQLGSRTERVVVSAKGPNRLSVDLTR